MPGRLLAHLDEIDRRLAEHDPVVLLDYDGTLTPIVADPDDAVLAPEMRETLRRLAASYWVAVVSGRDLKDVREKVGLPNLVYAGSHGFDVAGPGVELQHEGAIRALPALRTAEGRLREGLASVPGVRFERKRFSLAVHYRQVENARVPEVRRAVERTVRADPSLRALHGKRVLDVQPDVPWDKGKAIRWLLERLPSERRGDVPLYVGDDVTDEDAFRELTEDGLTAVVGEPWRESAAHYRLADVDEVHRFLTHLELRRADAARASHS